MKTSKIAKLNDENDILETHQVSPWPYVGRIIPTSNEPKEDVFNSYRPNRQCVDYKISETWLKMQKGDLKVNVKQVQATYEEIPLDICKPKLQKKIKLFHGGPPQWKFIEEVWREEVNVKQAVLKKEAQKISYEVKRKRNHVHKNIHTIVQDMAGPEWFMELNPQQLCAVDQLKGAVIVDICNGSTINCEEVIATLGLVLRPNKYHIKKALEYSCCDAVEFLLVLYQLIDSKRTAYSLNDRLLLSAVVHLSIISTLKELHIRIPSPPRQNLKVQKEIKKVKRQKLESPYLQKLTYEPPPPKFTGVYYNKHKQYPENSYFSYTSSIELEKRHTSYVLLNHLNDKDYMMELRNAEFFYQSIPGVKEENLHLIPPTIQTLCPNFLHPLQGRSLDPRFIIPSLCKVSSSEEVLCFCSKPESTQKKFRRSVCEKNARKLLNNLCNSNDCLEEIKQRNLIRIYGGVQKSVCSCDAPIPIILGTISAKICNCQEEYRNKIAVAAAKENLLSFNFQCVLGTVCMTKFGPVYAICGILGPKLCLCNEIIERKILINKQKNNLINNDTKFVHGGIYITKFGPIYSINAIVARKPCRCVLRYQYNLQVLEERNKLRTNNAVFVNNGLCLGKFGPIFLINATLDNSKEIKDTELRKICSCEIKKPKCFERCWNYLEYNVNSHHTSSTSSSSLIISSSEELLKESETESENSSESSDNNSPEHKLCNTCLNHQKAKSSTSSSSSSSTTTTTTSTTLSSEDTTTEPKNSNSSSESELSEKKSTHCRCKDELNRFLNSKCPCDECNTKIRQQFATSIVGGLKTSPSGKDAINVVQGIHQPLCSCLINYQANIAKVDDYKARIKARYDLRKQPKKYCISGVCSSSKGPVYVISGIRPPVECECAKAIREKIEQDDFERQRAKSPNTGRIKYEITGVKAMPEENIFIMSRALPVSPCKCEKVLSKFEQAHKSCMDEFEQYLEQTQNEKIAFLNELANSANRETLRSGNTMFDEGFENFLIHETGMEKVVIDSPDSEIDDTPKNKEQEEFINDKIEKEVDDAIEEQKEKSSSDSENEDSVSTDDDDDDDDDSSKSDEDSSESDGSCHVKNPPEVNPITIPKEVIFPESFRTKRFAIFRHMPDCSSNTMMDTLKDILKGMADDGFPLANLPEVHKLPIFKLWINLRSGVYWTYSDKIKSYAKSKSLWKHTDLCYQKPKKPQMPYGPNESRNMTWKNAKEIKRVAATKNNDFYRKIKQMNIDSGREFFATLFSYEFPTHTWRDCAFSYLATKEENLFPYRIIQPHESTCIPENKRLQCYC